jgi:two-component system chemotaxis response regulator CheB
MVIAQSQNTCAVYGMPKAVIDHRLADAVLPLEAIADAMRLGLPGSAHPSTSERTSSAT